MSNIDNFGDGLCDGSSFGCLGFLPLVPQIVPIFLLNLTLPPFQQDSTPGESYNRVIYTRITIESIAIVLGPIYDYLDGKWLGHSLRMSETDRVAYRNRVKAEKLDVRGW